MDNTMPNGAAPQAPVIPAQPSPVENVPQNLDKTDAMTYPLGSQAIELNETIVEDHRSILERIIGIFSKGKKEE
jgi:hypothetical protein